MLQEHGSVPLYTLPDRKQSAGEIPSDHLATRVHMVGRYNDMMQVTGAHVLVPIDGGKPGKIAASGWIDGRLLRVRLEPCSADSGERPATLYRQPDTASHPDHVIDQPRAAKVVGCDGTWWKVDAGDGQLGWVQRGNWCDHALTHCSQRCED